MEAALKDVFNVHRTVVRGLRLQLKKVMQENDVLKQRLAERAIAERELIMWKNETVNELDYIDWQKLPDGDGKGSKCDKGVSVSGILQHADLDSCFVAKQILERQLDSIKKMLANFAKQREGRVDQFQQIATRKEIISNEEDRKRLKDSSCQEDDCLLQKIQEQFEQKIQQQKPQADQIEIQHKNQEIQHLEEENTLQTDLAIMRRQENEEDEQLMFRPPGRRIIHQGCEPRRQQRKDQLGIAGKCLELGTKLQLSRHSVKKRRYTENETETNGSSVKRPKIAGAKPQNDDQSESSSSLPDDKETIVLVPDTIEADLQMDYSVENENEEANGLCSLNVSANASDNAKNGQVNVGLTIACMESQEKIKNACDDIKSNHFSRKEWPTNSVVFGLSKIGNHEELEKDDIKSSCLVSEEAVCSYTQSPVFTNYKPVMENNQSPPLFDELNCTLESPNDLAHHELSDSCSLPSNSIGKQILTQTVLYTRPPSSISPHNHGPSSLPALGPSHAETRCSLSYDGHLQVVSEHESPCHQKPDPWKSQLLAQHSLADLQEETQVAHQRHISFPLDDYSSNAKISTVGRKPMDILSPVDLDDSFDRLPPKVKDKAFVFTEVVRKQADRKKLKGFSCQECLQYYRSLGVTEAEASERMGQCSRHRGKQAPPSTPEHFWSLGFPDTQDC